MTGDQCENSNITPSSPAPSIAQGPCLPLHCHLQPDRRETAEQLSKAEGKEGPRLELQKGFPAGEQGARLLNIIIHIIYQILPISYFL